MGALKARTQVASQAPTAPARLSASTPGFEEASIFGSPYEPVGPLPKTQLATPPVSSASRVRSDSEETILPPTRSTNPSSPLIFVPPSLPAPPATLSLNPVAGREREPPPHLTTENQPNPPSPTPLAPSSPPQLTQPPTQPRSFSRMSRPNYVSPVRYASNDQMHRARERLHQLDHFDGKETKLQGHAWLAQFELYVRPYKPSDEQKLELWWEKIEPGSAAWDWAEQQEANIGSWKELLAAWDTRWPKPTANLNAKIAVKAWYEHTFDKHKINMMVVGPGGKEEKYYVAWAREHMARAAAMKPGADRERVEYTWMRVLPVVVRDMLPKRSLEDYKTVAQLCHAIMSLEGELVEHKTQAMGGAGNGVDELMQRLSNLELWARTPNPQPAAYPSLPAGSAVRFSDPPASGTGFNHTQPTTLARQPSFLRSSSPAPPSSTLASTIALQPSTPPAARGTTFDDTPAGRAAQAAIAKELPEEVSTLTSYPLTPATMKQSQKTCVNCGRVCLLCAQDVGEAIGNPDRPPTPPPRAWPKFLQTAIRQMNDRVLPSLGYAPRKLLTGILKGAGRAQRVFSNERQDDRAEQADDKATRRTRRRRRRQRDRSGEESETSERKR